MSSPLANSVCDIGVVFALPIEAGAFVNRLAGVIAIRGSGFRVREGGLQGRRVVTIVSEAGAEAAARATEALVAGHRPAWIVAAGFAGALRPELAVGDIVMADSLVDRHGKRLSIDIKVDREQSPEQRGFHVGRLLMMDNIVRRPAEKRELGERCDALAVDMESLAVAEVCAREKIRFLAVRAISDAVDDELPEEIERLLKKKRAAGRWGAAVRAVALRPAAIKDLWQLRSRALQCSSRLATFLVGMAPQLTRK